MATARLFGAICVLLLVGFFATKWLLMPRELRPDPRVPTFHRVEPDDPRLKFEASSASDNDPVRDRLRHDVLDYAKALSDDPCNDTLKQGYIKAATAYARAWISIAPCVGTRTCRNADSARLDLAQHAFGAPIDRRVREVMEKVHNKEMFVFGDFPKDVSPLVAEMAADGRINPYASPEAVKAFAVFRTPAACFGVTSQ